MNTLKVQLLIPATVITTVVSATATVETSATCKQQPVPRHDEIDENLARHILRELTGKK